jgi:DNA repair exonuclease SbcCD ATPase subunit
MAQPQDCIPQERIQQIQQFVQRISDINNRIGAERQANEAFKGQISQRIQALQQRIGQISPRIEGLAAQIGKLTQERDGFRQERDNVRAELQGLQGKLQQLTQERDAAVAQVAQITQQLADAQGQSQQMQQQLQEAQQKITQCEANMARCTEQINQILGLIDQIDASIQQNDASITQLHDAAGASYADVQQALAQLESDLDKALAGAPPTPAPAPSSLPPQPPVPGDQGSGEEEVLQDAQLGQWDPETPVTIEGRQVPLKQVIQGLQRKVQQIQRSGRDGPNKYSAALDRISVAQNPEELNAIVGFFRLDGQGNVRGGKTRKHGKRKLGKKSRKGKKSKKTQRGGYHAFYRNTRRRSTRRSTSSN